MYLVATTGCILEVATSGRWRLRVWTIAIIQQRGDGSPYFILFCAVGLSFTAAYYSVIGLSILFASVAIPVIVMGSFLEISKIAIATYLHDHWKKTYVMLKIYLTIALVVLSFITSLGI